MGRRLCFTVAYDMTFTISGMGAWGTGVVPVDIGSTMSLLPILKGSSPSSSPLVICSPIFDIRGVFWNVISAEFARRFSLRVSLCFLSGGHTSRSSCVLFLFYFLVWYLLLICTQSSLFSYTVSPWGIVLISLSLFYSRHVCEWQPLLRGANFQTRLWFRSLHLFCQQCFRPIQRCAKINIFFKINFLVKKLNVWNLKYKLINILIILVAKNINPNWATF